MSTIIKNCTILVSSCDRYSDLWNPYFSLLKKNWPDCPFEIALITEEKSANIVGVTSLCLGGKLDWSALVIRALDSIESENVLFSLEDFFLRQYVDTNRILALYKDFQSNGLNMLRLIPRPGPDEALDGRDYGSILLHAPYRVSTQAAFWKRDVLRSLLQAGESAWEFEYNGSKRSVVYPEFAAVWREALPYRHHVVERGKWFPWDYAKFSKMDIGVIPSARPVMSKKEAAIWLLKKTAATLRSSFPIL